jgi:hypothetical protein
VHWLYPSVAAVTVRRLDGAKRLEVQINAMRAVHPRSIASRSIFTSACRLARSRNIEATASNRPLRLYFSKQSLACDVAVDHDLIPLLGVTDIIDRHIVVLVQKNGTESNL